MSNDEVIVRLDTVVEEFTTILENTVKQLWNAQRIDFSLKNEYQVFFGLLSRHATLSINFTRSYSLWNDDMAPIIMRCLADNLINIKWILGDVSVRTDKFIKYGLGQEKLSIEHRKSQLLKDGKNPQSDPLIQAHERWISKYRFPMITDVDLGSWSGISVRQMAIEADCLDFYNYVYVPFSSAVHSQWNHIIKYNMTESDNPLHCSLLYPAIEEPSLNIHYLLLTAKYWDKAIKWIGLWSEFNSTNDLINLYDWTIEKIKGLEQC